MQGANDGVASTASLVLGVAGSGAGTRATLVAGVAGMVSGAMSMAAGEYVSVSSRADTESADLARERMELATNPAQEHAELTAIYVKRGLDEALASHAQDELGISDILAAEPVQIAFASAATFAVGAILPMLMVLLLPSFATVWGLPASSLVFLALLGFLAARPCLRPWRASHSGEHWQWA